MIVTYYNSANKPLTKVDLGASYQINYPNTYGGMIPCVYRQKWQETLDFIGHGQHLSVAQSRFIPTAENLEQDLNDSLNSSMVEGLQKQNEELWRQITEIRAEIRQKDNQIRSLSGDKTLIDTLEMQIYQKDNSISSLEMQVLRKDISIRSLKASESVYKDLFHDHTCDHSMCKIKLECLQDRYDSLFDLYMKS